MNQIAPTTRLRLDKQVAVMTGGSRGIGEGIVRSFVEEGAKVVFSGRSSEKGKTLEEETEPKRSVLPSGRCKRVRHRIADEIPSHGILAAVNAFSCFLGKLGLQIN
jgi:NAD(P)-dependent dehydrogenase (short-subunit alcohol dehydrogenase family)